MGSTPQKNCRRNLRLEEEEDVRVFVCCWREAITDSAPIVFTSSCCSETHPCFVISSSTMRASFSSCSLLFSSTIACVSTRAFSSWVRVFAREARTCSLFCFLSRFTRSSSVSFAYRPHSQPRRPFFPFDLDCGCSPLFFFFFTVRLRGGGDAEESYSSSRLVASLSLCRFAVTWTTRKMVITTLVKKRGIIYTFETVREINSQRIRFHHRRILLHLNSGRSNDVHFVVDGKSSAIFFTFTHLFQ